MHLSLMDDDDDDDDDDANNNSDRASAYICRLVYVRWNIRCFH